MTEKSGKTLTIKQEFLINALIGGQTILAASKIAGISEKTAHTYLKLPHVAAAYKQQRQEVFNEALQLLMNDVDAAIRGIKILALDKEVPPAVRLRGYQIWLETAIEQHKMTQLEQKIADLEQALLNLKEG